MFRHPYTPRQIFIRCFLYGLRMNIVTKFEQFLITPQGVGLQLMFVVITIWGLLFVIYSISNRVDYRYAATQPIVAVIGQSSYFVLLIYSFVLFYKVLTF